MGISRTPGVSDPFKNKTSQYAKASTSTGGLTTVINVSGSGYLTGISQLLTSTATPTTVRNGTLKITIDGAVVINDTDFSSTSYGANANSSLAMLSKFKTSLLIEHASPTSTDTTIKTKVAYLLD